MADRASCYARAFHDMPGGWLTVVREHDRDVLRGEWSFGQDYRNTSEYYGAYPGNFIARLQAIFPEFTIMPGMLPMSAGRMLHAFSGSLAPGPYDRCDVTQDAEYRCDVRELPSRVGDAYDLVAADPPYSDEDAARYKAPPLDRGALTSALAAVTRIGGHVAWLDTVWPMHSKEELVTVGLIYVRRSTNHRVRLLTLFERVDGGAR